MATPKSPFLVYREFLSAKYCEHLVDRYGFYTEPDKDLDGTPIKMSRHEQEVEDVVFSQYEGLGKELQDYYNFELRGTTEMMIDFYPYGASPKHTCDNSDFLRKSWVRVRDFDFSCVIFLNDHQAVIPFDNEYEVYGGKLEFPTHNFGFLPERGTMIVYPSSAHFINTFAPILYGEMYVIKFNIAASLPYMYNPNNFPGDYSTWFKHLD